MNEAPKIFRPYNTIGCLILLILMIDSLTNLTATRSIYPLACLSSVSRESIRSVSDVYKFLTYAMHMRVHLDARLNFARLICNLLRRRFAAKKFARVKPTLPCVKKFDAKLVRGGELFSKVSNESWNCLGLLKAP